MPTAGPTVDRLFLAFQQALAGRYSIDRELGRGGMGVVYLAREVHLDRMVAIKLLPPDRAVDPALRERFLREARTSAKLSHPNIIPIHAVDEAGEFVFYVMAYIDGETLAHRVRTRGPFPSSEGARVLREVSWALAHAHGNGVVHRDVKPDNIMIETNSGRVLVADFGIAAVAADVSGSGVAGTPEFMSPEQAMNQHVDARSDLYSLGITAFHMFTGRLPFEGKTPTEVLARQVTEEPPSLSSSGMPVARKIAQVVDRCLRKNPAHRPASAEVVAEQLGFALEQRRELPAALRAFVKREGRLNGGGTLLGPPILVGMAFGAAWFFGAQGAIATLAIGTIAAPFTYFVDAARRLLRLGFSHADVGPAFAAELEQNRDEHMVIHGKERSAIEGAFKLVATTSWVILGAGLVGAYLDAFRSARVELLFVAFLSAVLSTIGRLALLDRRTDVDTEFWAKVWNGRIGRSAFAVAKKFLGKGARASAVTHRATELSLGLAAESLYERLPLSTRKSLGDLPAVVTRLQNDAQRLRKLHDELNDALGALGETPISDDHRAVLAHRDRVHAKLGATVGALETIRLNLLRLHAGSGNVEGLTTHIDLAAEISAEVERMLAARGEVEKALSFPRSIVATPT